MIIKIYLGDISDCTSSPRGDTSFSCNAWTFSIPNIEQPYGKIVKIAHLMGPGNYNLY